MTSTARCVFSTFNVTIHSKTNANIVTNTENIEKLKKMHKVF